MNMLERHAHITHGLQFAERGRDDNRNLFGFLRGFDETRTSSIVYCKALWKNTNHKKTRNILLQSYFLFCAQKFRIILNFILLVATYV